MIWGSSFGFRLRFSNLIGWSSSMGLLRSLAWFFLCILFFWLPEMSSQLTGSSLSQARSLDALLQVYAYRAFDRPKTGIPYTGSVPSNLTGIEIAAMRLRRGSLRTKGVKKYNEFQIPTGVVEQPYVERLVLVYQNLGNWSTVYYPPPAGYMYLAPVLGLLAYNASNLSATGLPELDIEASGDPIMIKFQNVESAPDGKCVFFDLNGGFNISNLTLSSTCSTFGQGHFSIVGESVAPSPTPPAPRGLTPNIGPSGKKNNNTKVWIIVGSVVGGLVVLILLGCLAAWVGKYKRRKEMQHMEKASDEGEALQMTSVGSTKAPSATVTRTQPVLETEYVP